VKGEHKYLETFSMYVHIMHSGAITEITSLSKYYSLL